MSGATVTEPGERAVGKGRWRQRLAATIVATAALAACSCSGDDDDPPAETTTSSSTTTNAEVEVEVEAAYLAYWEMLTRLSTAPDPNDPEIADRATGQAQVDVVNGLASLTAEGHRAIPGPLYSHTVISATPSVGNATVRDCAVDDSTIVDATTDETVSGGDPVTVLLEVTLLSSGGRWRVEQVRTIQSWSGVTTCEQ